MLAPAGIPESSRASLESVLVSAGSTRCTVEFPGIVFMNRRHMNWIRWFLLGSVVGMVLRLNAGPTPTYREPWRPQFHFTPADTWMNDPNGMFFYDGEYHLFYQSNPFGNRWGHMSWGHAVSRDLTHWEHLPLALAEENGVMIFSGSAVVDWKNTSGFGRDGRPPLVAIYTGHYTTRPLQNQQLAYSNDRGRTWTKFAGNPVLDIGATDFRDPKVFWHEPTGRWVMAVSWPLQRKIRFYSSPDLKSWTHLSDFGPAGSTSGIWECPDLFPVTVAGRAHESHWVLVVNVGSGAPAGGSGTQYFVGEFDGTRFVPDERSTPRPEREFVPEGRVLGDFEGGSYGGWTATGDAFGSAPAGGGLGGQQAVDGFRGRGLVNSFREGDRSQGTLTSPEFVIDHDYLSFLIGGGNQPGKLGVNLLVTGQVVRTATGADAERLAWRSWDVRDLRGRTARLEIVDRATGGWGHINADHFVLADRPARNASESALWADFGRDFYAGVSWSDVPKRDGRRLWIGWMSNWNYANEVPTEPWRSAMSVPRELLLRDTPDGWRLLQSPVREMARLRTGGESVRKVNVSGANGWLAAKGFPSGLAELELKLVEIPKTGVLTLHCRHGNTGETRMEVDFAAGELRLDRTQSGRSDFNPTFAGVHTAPLRIVDGRLNLRLLFDVSSVEIFAQGGESVVTDLVLPESPPLGLSLTTAGQMGDLRVDSLSLWTLKAAQPALKNSKP